MLCAISCSAAVRPGPRSKPHRLQHAGKPYPRSNGPLLRYVAPGYDAATAGRSPRRYPVLYFLHGLGDNEQTLFKAGGWGLIEDLRQQRQISDFLIIAPEGKSSFYINSADGRVRYSDFFIREFIPYIESHYSIRRERSARAISGFSMGGYGALRFAFAYPELFSSVSAQSAALIAEPPRQTEATRTPTPLSGLFGAVFGNPIDAPSLEPEQPFCPRKAEPGTDTGYRVVHLFQLRP